MKTIATWDISLVCECPECNDIFDIFNEFDIIQVKDIEIGEHGTNKTTNIEITCPECGSEFLVDLGY